VDRSVVFLTYLTFLGDADKTAAALDIPAWEVEALVESEGWKPKAAALARLRKDHGADALLREMNRVTNYVQGVRLRHVVDRVLKMLGTDAGFDEFTTHRTKDTANFSAMGIVELRKAAEVAHRLTYQALGDSVGERLSREDSESQVSASVIKSLASMAGVAPLKALPDSSPQ
jgi:hypothetical protein